MNRSIQKMIMLGLCLAGIVSAVSARNLGLDWVKQLGGGTSADYSQSIAVDAKGNVYTTGYYQNTGYFNLPDTTLGRVVAKGSWDVYVTKHDAVGNYIWSKSMGSTLSDQGYEVAVDETGNVYVTGYFNGKGDFDPGADSLMLTSNGKQDVFLTKLDSSGNLLWSKSFGGPENDIGWSVAPDAWGNVYITGTFTGSVDFDPGAGSTVLTALSGINGFIAKFDKDGDLSWANHLSGYGGSQANSIAVDGAGNVIITGVFDQVVDLKPIAIATSLTSKGGYDMFVAKLDSTGTFIWGKSLGGINDDISFSVALNDLNEVHIAGYFKDSLIMDPATGIPGVASLGDNDAAVAKLDASGKFLWLKKVGGTGRDFGEAVAVDVSRNVYVVGEFNKTAYFSADTANYKLEPRGNLDNFILKLDPQGTFVWAKQMGGTNLEQSNDIQVDQSGNLYVAGYFRSSDANFDPDGVAPTLLKAVNADGFIVKLICADTNSSVLTLATCEKTYSILGQTFTSTGIYPVRLPNLSGCDSTVQVDITFNVLEIPVITVDKQTLGTTGDYSTYQWILNDVLIAGAEDSTYQVTENGFYRVIVTDANGCKDTSAVYEVTNASSVKEIHSLGKQTFIYPNPSIGELHIKSLVTVDVVITSIEGRVMKTVANATVVPIHELGEGIYLIRIRDKAGNLIKVEKMVKSR